MLFAQSESPSEQLMGVLDFRIESFQSLLTGELLPLERRAELVRRRRESLTGESSPLLRGVAGDDSADVSANRDLPENVSVEEGAPDEAVDVAAENAENFARVTVASDGTVRGHFHGTINAQTLREPDTDQSIAEGNKSMTERGEIPASSSEHAQSTRTGPPSMSEAGRAKQREKREVRSDGGIDRSGQTPQRSSSERPESPTVDGIKN